MAGGLPSHHVGRRAVRRPHFGDQSTLVRPCNCCALDHQPIANLGLHRTQPFPVRGLCVEPLRRAYRLCSCRWPSGRVVRNESTVDFHGATGQALNMKTALDHSWSSAVSARECQPALPLAPRAPCRSGFMATSCAPQYSQLWVPFGGKLNTALCPPAPL